MKGFHKVQVYPLPPTSMASQPCTGVKDGLYTLPKESLLLPSLHKQGQLVRCTPGLTDQLVQIA